MVQRSGGMVFVLQSLRVLEVAVRDVALSVDVTLSHAGPMQSMCGPVDDAPSPVRCSSVSSEASRIGNRALARTSSRSVTSVSATLIWPYSTASPRPSSCGPFPVPGHQGIRWQYRRHPLELTRIFVKLNGIQYQFML
ncbi:hypothetical protein BDA96_02G186300 [Sorghum bicolor]|uniref:Uncharacterized protein n=2 Tax=Sorghum bicolor TaxID=4558 RepID=A0A921UVV4_SORBI|nr:hypothetical protein BDA96_02G186300 [Sorghum bicolor]KXG35456.1 hypothetical protein SORBI_3002G176600 [Sorghum bicolor]